MGFQMQICSILRFSWSILEKFCVHRQMSSSKTQMPQILTVFRDSLRLHLTFVAFFLLSAMSEEKHPPLAGSKKWVIKEIRSKHNKKLYPRISRVLSVILPRFFSVKLYSFLKFANLLTFFKFLT